MLYLVPTVPTVLPGTQQTVPAPKYVDFTIPFSAIPYGGEGWTFLSTDAVLLAAPDLYQFPDDLTAVVQDADVVTLDAFLAQLPAPSDWIVAGMPFADVVRLIAQIFLLAQAVYGATATSIFAGGTTLDSPVAPITQGRGQVGQQTQQNAIAQVAGTTVGPFDLTGVDGTATIADVLTSVGQQFTDPILIGQGQI